jgi:hypothetical protein
LYSRDTTGLNWHNLGESVTAAVNVGLQRIRVKSHRSTRLIVGMRRVGSGRFIGHPRGGSAPTVSGYNCIIYFDCVRIVVYMSFENMFKFGSHS